MLDYRLVISKRAIADLRRLHKYISKDSPQNAQRMVSAILDGIELLRSTPHRAPIDDDLSNSIRIVRKLPIRPYVVYFRAVDEQKIVRIIHIRHGSRLPPKRL